MTVGSSRMRILMPCAASHGRPVTAAPSVERRKTSDQPSTSGRSHSSETTFSSGTRRSALLGGTTALVSLLAGSWLPCYADGGPEQALKQSLGKTLRAPREFLRARLRADDGAKILAPIRASKQKLLDVEKALRGINIYDPSPEAYKNILKGVRTASLNCYVFEPTSGDSLETRASQLQKTIGFGDACTYRLIAKNVTVLLKPAQAKLKEDTLKQLDELINSYQLLDDMVDRAREGDPSAVERIPDVLQFTMAHVDTFESLIERCLDLPISNVAPAAPLPI